MARKRGFALTEQGAVPICMGRLARLIGGRPCRSHAFLACSIQDLPPDKRWKRGCRASISIPIRPDLDYLARAGR